MKTTQISPGDHFGRLEVLARAPDREGNRNSWWTCRCACGTVKDIRSCRLTGGHPTRSCGCLKSEQKRAQLQTHGMSDTPVYAVWRNMIQRCTDKGSKDYPRWGGRG